MILYFSGTGNSLYIAKKLAEAFNERIISIADLVCREQYELTVKNNKTIGFVFPVIACAPPDIVTKFIKKYLLECDEHINQVVEDINQRKCNFKKEKHSFVLS